MFGAVLPLQTVIPGRLRAVAQTNLSHSNLDLFSAKLSEIPGSRPASAGRAPE
jgi:hypothetical protein